MRPVPFGLDDVNRLAAATAAPLVPSPTDDFLSGRTPHAYHQGSMLRKARLYLNTCPVSRLARRDSILIVALRGLGAYREWLRPSQGRLIWRLLSLVTVGSTILWVARMERGSRLRSLGES